MLQYLLNLTGIWLLSLAVFDLFLRRESYHTYNRIYLLVTMLAGVFFPLLRARENGMRFYPVAMEQPLRGVVRAKANIVAAAEASGGVTWEQWLTLLYIMGAAVVAGLLVRDIVKLIDHYRTGRRSIAEDWTLIETGKGHAPFSFMNMLFVSKREDYNDEEWQMILQHERKHSTLLHVVDLFIVHLAKIAFWFHPLVYVYAKRLLLVHEYQADKVALKQPKVYGRFLAEQAVLHAAPSVTHSFNRSPIKKRIVMLTQRSSAVAKSKMALVLPLTIACTLLFSQISYSKRFEKKGNAVTYRGNTFEYGKTILDTIELTDPVNGSTTTRVRILDAVPEKMNGKVIYKPTQLTAQPQTFSQNGSVTDYVFRKLSDVLNKLPDGTYKLDIKNVVIGPNGKIAYYEGAGLSLSANMPASKMKDAIDDKIDQALNSVPALKPGIANGNTVPVLSDISFNAYQIEVKNHQSTFGEVWK